MAINPPIPNVDRVADYTPSGSTANFVVAWPVYFSDGEDPEIDLGVMINGVELTPDAFSFAGNPISGLAGVYNGGTVTLITPVSAERVVIWSHRDPRRVGYFLEGKSLPFSELDKLLNDMIVQIRDLSLSDKRSIKVSVPDYLDGVPFDDVSHQLVEAAQSVSADRVATEAAATAAEAAAAGVIYKFDIPIYDGATLPSFTTDGQLVNFGGRTNRGDGLIAPEFVYDASDTTTASNGYSVIVNGIGQRAKIIHRTPTVRLKEYLKPGATPASDAAFLAALADADAIKGTLDIGGLNDVFMLKGQDPAYGLGYAFTNKAIIRGNGSTIKLATQAVPLGRGFFLDKITAGALLEGFTVDANNSCFYGAHFRNREVGVPGDLIANDVRVINAVASADLTNSPSGNPAAVGLFIDGGFTVVTLDRCGASDCKIAAGATGSQRDVSGISVEVNGLLFTRYLTIRDPYVKNIYSKDKSLHGNQDGMKLFGPIPSANVVQDMSTTIYGGEYLNNRGRSIKMQRTDALVLGGLHRVDGDTLSLWDNNSGLMRIDDQFGGLRWDGGRVIYSGCGDQQVCVTTNRNYAHGNSVIENLTVSQEGSYGPTNICQLADSATGTLVRRPLTMRNVSVQNWGHSIDSLLNVYTYNTTNGLAGARAFLDKCDVNDLGTAAVTGQAAGASGNTFYDVGMQDVTHFGNSARTKVNDISTGGSSCTLNLTESGSNKGLT
jgi:hypothetical protein